MNAASAQMNKQMRGIPARAPPGTVERHAHEIQTCRNKKKITFSFQPFSFLTGRHKGNFLE